MSNNHQPRAPRLRSGGLAQAPKPVTSGSRTSSPTRSRRATLGDQGQAALILVIGLVMLMTTVGGVMLTSIDNNDPILTQASIQRLAYRALASGLNAYQSAINGNPFLAACNTTTNVGAANASAACSGISYETWSVVPGTDVGNGVIPEYYKFDNPYAVVNSTTNALTYLDVEVVGAAGFGTNVVYYSTVAKFTPANGFLNNVWWSNFESYNQNSDTNPGTINTATGCSYYYSTNYSNSGSCTPVYFGPSDSITGPIFTNDSIFVSGKPNFGANYSVTTADPSCLFVDPLDGNHGSPTGCTSATSDVGTYDAATSSNSQNNLEPIPTDNSALGNFAKQGGCYYEGPTTITLNGNQMTVSSPGTPTSPSPDFASDSSTCPTNGTASLPQNGVVFVDQGGTGTIANPINPLDGVSQQTCVTHHGQQTCTTSTIDSQTSTGGCTGCYYGQTSDPETEADAFVSGSLSGHLTVGSDQNIIIDGPLTYADCTWANTASQSNCGYNSFTSSSQTNDTLGLIAYNYVEVNMPVSGPPGSNPSVLATCGTSGARAAPLCDPSTSSGDPAGTQNGSSFGLTIDASLLALQGSFIVNNYQTQNNTNTNPMNNEGTLTVYGSIQQDARGAGASSRAAASSPATRRRTCGTHVCPSTPPRTTSLRAPRRRRSPPRPRAIRERAPPSPPAQSLPTTTQPTFNQSGWAACTVP